MHLKLVSKSVNSGQGFILWILLCFFTLLSLLITSGLRHLLIYHQAMLMRELNHQHFYQLEYALRMVLRAPFDNSCIKLLQTDEKLLQDLRHKQGCILMIKKKEYLYLIEDLGDFPCLIGQNQKLTQHFRITLFSDNDEKTHLASLLQIRWIKRTIKNKECLGTKRLVKEGISSWRYAMY